MKLIHRIGYYLGGLSMGIVILVFFLTGKKASCSYLPEARVLKNINSKTIKYSESVLSAIAEKNLDSLAVNTILLTGDVDFSESKARKKPCGIYNIKGKINDQEIALTVENCDSIATIKELK